MKFRGRAWLAGATALLLLGGCATMDGMGPKQQGGAIAGGLAGAAAGGFIGSQFGRGSGNAAATGLGVLVGAIGGALMGSSIGQSLDNADRAAMQQGQAFALNRSTPIGTPYSWENPRNGNQVSYVPIAENYGPGGQLCRDYEQTIIVNGRIESGRGRACLRPDGNWQILNG